MFSFFPIYRFHDLCQRASPCKERLKIRVFSFGKEKFFPDLVRRRNETVKWPEAAGRWRRKGLHNSPKVRKQGFLCYMEENVNPVNYFFTSRLPFRRSCATDNVKFRQSKGHVVKANRTDPEGCAVFLLAGAEIRNKHFPNRLAREKKEQEKQWHKVQ